MDICGLGKVSKPLPILKGVSKDEEEQVNIYFFTICQFLPELNYSLLQSFLSSPTPKAEFSSCKKFLTI